MQKIRKFFGSTTIGKKGQVVIPMETRNKMKWKESDKLLVFGLDNGIVVLTKLDHVKQLAIQLEKKLVTVKKYIKKSV